MNGLPAVVGLFVVVGLAACFDGGRVITTGQPSIPVPPLPTELVGDWSQRTAADVTGAYQRRILRFRREGVYEYWNERCASYNTDCAGGYEWGYARIDAQTLTFLPQTPSPEGQRAYPFEITRDAIGALTLRLHRPTDIDVFFFGPP